MMRRVGNLLLGALAGAWLSVAAPLHASPVFDGTAADLWLLDPDTGRITGLNFDKWLSDFFLFGHNNPIYVLAPREQAFINNLQLSSVRMSPNQPLLSLAGLDAPNDDGGAGGQNDLDVSPATGTYDGTIAVEMRVNTAIIEKQNLKLYWRLGTNPEQQLALTANTLRNTDAPVRGGYYVITEHLVEDGRYPLHAELRDAAGISVLATVDRQFIVASTHPDGFRRDTDGDGIPDFVEAAIGIDPLSDDWLVDSDGDGWSDFDEWLRKYCLNNLMQPDPAQGIGCLDGDGNPLDTDGDGWSDFDEKLRRTQFDDKTPNLTPQGDETPQSKAFIERTLRYFDVPTARRLYEVERVVAAGNLLPTPPAPASYIVDQQNDAPPSSSYRDGAIQSFVPTADNINGIDIILGGGDALFDDLTLLLWADPLRGDRPLAVSRLENVATDKGSIAAFRFPAVPLTPGATYYMEIRAAEAWVATQSVPGSYANGAVVEASGLQTGGLLFNGQVDLLFKIYADGTFANGRGGLAGTASWDDVRAASISDETLYSQIDLLFPGDISGAGLTFADIADRLEAMIADEALRDGEIPPMRIRAGDSSVIGAALIVEPPAVAAGEPTPAAAIIYKTWLDRIADATPQRLLAENGVGSWTTVDEWRAAFVAYLQTGLAPTTPITIDARNTDVATLMEVALSQESAYRSGGTTILADDNPDDAIIELSQPDLEALNGSDYSLDDALANFNSASSAGQPLEDVAAWIVELRDAAVPGTRSDTRIVEAFRQSYDIACYITTKALGELGSFPQAFSEFAAQCPDWFTEDDLPGLATADTERRHAVRLFLLPGSVPEAVGDITLLDANADSDVDALSNGNEIDRALDVVTLPWLTDTDGDLLADGADICARDPLNECSSAPVLPGLTPGADIFVSEPTGGAGIAVISVVLDRAYDRPVTIYYTPVMGNGDNATPDADFDATPGSVTIAPGDRVALITIPVFADGLTESDETFTVNITSADNAVVLDDAIIVVSISNTISTGPNAILLTESQIVNERDPVDLDASPSNDPGGAPLTFSWRQIDNGSPLVAVTGGNTAQPGFTAPEVLVVTNLLFEVTVMNPSGLSATAQASVQVNPVNDPPFVTGTPAFQVIVDNTLEIADETLLAYVDDPEDDALTIGAITQTPAFGQLTDTGTGFAYDPDAGAGGGGANLAEDVSSSGSVNARAGFASPIVQTFRPTDLHPTGLNNLAGVDVLPAANTAPLTGTVTMKLWIYTGGGLRVGSPLAEATRANVSRDEVIEFRFPAVTVVPGFEYALEFIGTDGFIGAVSPGAYAGGAVIEEGGVAQAGTDDLWFKTYNDLNFPTGGVVALQLSDPRIIDWQVSGDERTVILHERDSSANPTEDRIVAFSLETGQRTVLLNDSPGGFLRSPPGSSTTYILTGTPGIDGQLHRYDPDATSPFVSAPWPQNIPPFIFWETAVDPRTGDLHYCDRDSDENPITPRWYRVNHDDLSVTPYGDNRCSGSRTMSPMRIGQRFCVLFDLDTVYCTDPGGNELGVAADEFTSNSWRGPGSTLDLNGDEPQDGVVQVGDSALIFLRNTGFPVNEEVFVYLLHEDSWVTIDEFGEQFIELEPTLLMYRDNNVFSKVPEVQELPGGGAAIAFASLGDLATIGDQTLELWTWNGDTAATALDQINIGTITTLADNYDSHIGKLQLVDGKLYWQFQDIDVDPNNSNDIVDNGQRFIYEVDTTLGAPTPLTLLQTVPGALNTAASYQNTRAPYDILVAGPNTAGVLTDGPTITRCNIVNIADGSTAQSDVECSNHASVPGVGLLYEDIFDQNLFLIGFPTQGTTGPTSFSVEVEDTGGNSVVLPVQIEVLPPL